MASFDYSGVDEYGNDISVHLPDFTGCLLLATTTTPPDGTLVADGSEVSRKAYDKLFAVFGTRFGEGDGTNTFNLPDWRDEFPRFSGADRAVGSKQGDAIRNITASSSFRNMAEGYNIITDASGALGVSSSSAVTGIAASDMSISVRILTFDASRQVPIADENRPRNVAFLPCIIYV